MSELLRPEPSDQEMGKVLLFPENDSVDPESEDMTITHFFQTVRGQERMNQLINRFDNSTDLVHEIRDLLEKASNNPGRIVSILLSEAGTEGLNDPSFVESFKQNPAMERTLGFIKRTQYDGYIDGSRFYGKVLTLFANISRYEILHDSYDPESAEWESWASKIPYVKIGKYVQYHPDRYKGPPEN